MMKPRYFLWLLIAVSAFGCAEEEDNRTLYSLDITANPPGMVGVGSPDASADGLAVDATTPEDEDGDGLFDALEVALFERHRPAFSMTTSDACALSGEVYRVRLHPEGSGEVLLQGVLFFARDCGIGGHEGDVVGWSALVDPTSVGANEGLLSLRVDTGFGEACSHSSECGACSDLEACEFAVDGRARVFVSGQDHRLFLDSAACATAPCGGPLTCESTATRQALALNVGEPDAPLVSDLTAAGVITSANGWAIEALMDHDPWGGLAFGEAGAMSGALDASPQAVCTP